MAKRVDGIQLAAACEAALLPELRDRKLTIAVLHVGTPTRVTNTYLEKKRALGERLGVHVTLEWVDPLAGEAALRDRIAAHALDGTVAGIVVQLPLPPGFDTDRVLATIPPEKDIDALGPAPLVISPVAGALAEVLSTEHISLAGKHIVVAGRGRLVGRPVAAWLRHEGHDPVITDYKQPDFASVVAMADILITGMGKARVITAELVKPGAVLLDAGTSELEGVVSGDIDPAAHERASVFTPVSGGIGPLTLVKLYQNLLPLAVYRP